MHAKYRKLANCQHSLSVTCIYVWRRRGVYLLCPPQQVHMYGCRSLMLYKITYSLYIEHPIDNKWTSHHTVKAEVWKHSTRCLHTSVYFWNCSGWTLQCERCNCNTQCEQRCQKYCVQHEHSFWHSNLANPLLHILVSARKDNWSYKLYTQAASLACSKIRTATRAIWLLCSEHVALLISMYVIIHSKLCNRLKFPYRIHCGQSYIHCTAIGDLLRHLLGLLQSSSSFCAQSLNVNTKAIYSSNELYVHYCSKRYAQCRRVLKL